MKVERQVLQDFDTFIRNAEALVSSFMPVGFGLEYQRAKEQCEQDLANCRRRFLAALKKAKRDHGWYPN